jgi:glycosyltransferase involved in cell wall biosynthesis
MPVVNVRILILSDKDLVGATRNGPDVLAMWSRLEPRAIFAERWIAGKWPWNPFGRSATALRGLDPLRTLRLLIRQFRYDAVLCYFEASSVGPALLRRFGLLRRPLMIGDFSAGTSWRLRLIMQRIALPAADGVLCLSSSQMRFAEENFGLAGRTAFIGYDVDERFFDARLSTNGDYVLAVGDDISRDFPTLLEAMRGLDLPLRLRTSQRVAIPDELAGRVETIARYLSYAELRDLYAGARIVVLPLHDMVHPGGITTLVEALSMGKPVICSKSTGVADLLRDGKSAIVVPPEDPVALRAAIARLDMNSTLRARLGAAARAQVERELSISAASERIHAALQRFVAKH